MSDYSGRLWREEWKNGGHGYKFGRQRVPGVTTVLNGGYPKPALVQWAAKLVGRAAVEQPDRFARCSGDDGERVGVQVLDEARGGAMLRGKERHAYAEQLMRGEAPLVAAEHVAAVDRYIEFVRAWHVQPVGIEVVVGNRTHGYAGQLDLLAYIEHGAALALLDVKTGASGIWPETALQLTAYRHAEVYLDSNGREQPMPRVDMTAALWLQDDRYEVVPVETGDDVFDAFLAVLNVYRFAGRKRDETVGVPLLNPLPEEAAS